ncbi:hypothetical protein ACFP2T_32125 [Plantactinospora solaniradicis]|uniref:Uncharacterized protein n=1 Tax=Plantactinospora solaniradicis TaxID=1723736 RepID=A0ABW1KGH3_9ACTN
MLMLNGVTRDNAGGRLLRLLNDMRNARLETRTRRGRRRAVRDPLLVVAAGDDLDIGDPADPIDAKPVHLRWQEDLPTRERARRWFLPFRVELERPHRGAYRDVTDTGVPHMRRAWMSAVTVGMPTSGSLLSLVSESAGTGPEMPSTVSTAPVSRWSAR